MCLLSATVASLEHANTLYWVHLRIQVGCYSWLLQSGCDCAKISNNMACVDVNVGTRNAEYAADRVPPTVPEGIPSSLPNGIASRQAGQHARDSPHATLADAETPSGAQTVGAGGSHGALTIDMMHDMFNKGQAQMQKYIDDTESRLMTRISSRTGTSEAPAYHTQHIKDHVDRGLSTMKEEFRGWLSDFQTEMLKQFHLAQEDIIEVDHRLTKRTDALTAAVEQLRHQIQAESDNRRRVANLMR